MKQPKGWHREDIKATIRKKGATLRSISINAGLCRDAATTALAKPFPAGQGAIADFLNLPLHTLWPHWYDENGQRIASSSKRKATPKKDCTQCKKSAGKLAARKEILPQHPDSAPARSAQASGDGVAALTTTATPKQSSIVNF
jgi:Ner family transcriptional regulator